MSRLVMKKLQEDIETELQDSLTDESTGSTEEIISLLKVYADDIKILHRNLIGGNWFGDHELISSYYDKLETMTDETTEILLALGFNDISISDAASAHQSIEVREYTAEEAYEIIRNDFLHLIEVYQGLEDSVPGYVYSKFEEYMYDLKLEADFKIAKKLK